MFNAAILGLGGVAQAVHVPAYKVLEERGKARLVAACDIDPGQFTKKQEINLGAAGAMPENLRTYTDLEEMLAKERLDLIDICLPTDLHSKYAIDMLARGYHVESEKPMARGSEECAAMIEAAKAAKGRLMIGQCLRFSDEYLFLKDAIDNNTFGRPISAVFRRQSGPPLWSSENWLMDHARSGGCLLDMHIHDIDIARFLFGEPGAVSCVAEKVYSGDDIVHSRLIYDGLAVFAVGDWSQYGADFAADYRVGFEKATVICEAGVVTIYPREGQPWKPALSGDSMYMKELEYLIDMAVSGAPNTKNPPESAAASVRLVEKLKSSADRNGEIVRLQ
ncbi:MAG: Gfo/Idh/MocA family oxidoreductase [Defluviitaleaceae bacterium]|nr:Gfo/Idh/MocA family oxidoreductase [Defluviitaleaceae bacterium]